MVRREQLALSLLVGTFIGAAAGYLGHLMVSKRMALVGGALGHMTILGITLGFLYGIDISITSLIVLLIGIFLIWLFELRSGLPTEALTGVVFASSVAIGFLFLPRPGIELAVLGDITRIGFWDGLVAIAISVLIIAVHHKMLCPKLTLADVSEELAKSVGIEVEKYHLLYLACIALLVAFCVKIVGALLTAAIVVIPASAARNFSKNFRQYCRLGALIGAITSIAGIIAYALTGLPAGPLIIIASTIVFLISLALKR